MNMDGDAMCGCLKDAARKYEGGRILNGHKPLWKRANACNKVTEDSVTDRLVLWSMDSVEERLDPTPKPEVKITETVRVREEPDPSLKRKAARWALRKIKEKMGAE